MIYFEKDLTFISLNKGLINLDNCKQIISLNFRFSSNKKRCS